MITKDQITKAQQCLIDNGIDADESETVLQALGYILMNKELFSDKPILKLNKTPEVAHKYMLIHAHERDIITSIFLTLDAAREKMLDELYQALEGFEDLSRYELGQMLKQLLPNEASDKFRDQIEPFGGYDWGLQAYDAWSSVGGENDDWKIVQL